MNQIKILPDFLANQIAAGEVVQRPESVIKELVENAIDAGGTDIAVFVKNAGKQLIHILDNGRGMSAEDLPLAVKRHATSKIFSQADLEQIRSFGFRGEALASIASVAHIEIRSKQKESELGNTLISKPNSEPTVEQINMENGTQIFVRNLFYNVPARRKFLRSNLTEFKHISETMTKFALAHNDRRFTFYDDNNLIFDVKAESLKERIGHLFGSDTANNLLAVDYSDGIIKITGVIGKPELAKKTGVAQYFFLNTRSIISKSLSYAVFRAYENIIEKTHKPFYVLKIELDPQRVDVNVHPQKHEVKFDDEALVHNAIRNATFEALRQENILCDVDILDKQSEAPIEKVYPDEDSEDFLLVNTTTGEIIGDSDGRYETPRSYGAYTPSHKPSHKGSAGSSNRSYQGNKGGDNSQNNFWKEGRGDRKNNYSSEISAFEECFGEIETPSQEQTNLELHINNPINENQVWQYNKHYFLCKIEDKLVLIDTLKAMQRILYEKNLERLRTAKPVSQKLLFPIIVQLPVSKKAVLDEIIDEIEKFGFGVKENRENFEIFEIPPEIDESASAKAFIDIIDSYHDYKLLRMGDLHDNLAVAIAVHAYLPKSENMSSREMASIANELLACNMPNICPRGKKSMVIFTPANVSDMFR